MDENTEARSREGSPEKLKGLGTPWSPFPNSGAFSAILKSGISVKEVEGKQDQE